MANRAPHVGQAFQPAAQWIGSSEVRELAGFLETSRGAPVTNLREVLLLLDPTREPFLQEFTPGKYPAFKPLYSLNL